MPKLPHRPRLLLLSSLAALATLGLAATAGAQGAPPWAGLPPVDLPAAAPIAVAFAIPPVGEIAAADRPAPLLAPRPPLGRPPALVPLYLTFAGLQALDAVSTLGALDEGASERNPVVEGLAKHPVALIAAKAGVAAGTVYLSERLWKRNRAAAVVTMIVLNGAYAAIVANNHGAWGKQ